MKLLSWNIQWSRGIDGRVDPARIVAAARALGDFDVLCLQEVAAGFPALAGSSGENQFALFAGLLPGFTAVPGAAVDIPATGGAGRGCFGNLILSRYPVLRVQRHQLPWPADAAVVSMPRLLLEATLDTPLGPLRVLNTHLEYHSQIQRAAQVEALRSLHAEHCARVLHCMAPAQAGSPYALPAQTTRTILTGDFNFRPTDALHARVQAPFDDGAPRLVDTWRHLHGEAPHPHNVGIYDRAQWEEAFTCDFIFASEDLLPQVRRFTVDGLTQASDHQPQLLELA